jgi:hypothetical protein
VRAVSRDLWKCRLGIWSIQEVRWSIVDGEGAGGIVLFGNGITITNGGYYLTYIREYYQQLDEWSLLVIGYHI